MYGIERTSAREGVARDLNMLRAAVERAGIVEARLPADLRDVSSSRRAAHVDPADLRPKGAGDRRDRASAVIVHGGDDAVGASSL